MSRQANSIGLSVTLVSIALIVVGFMFLPWVTSGDGETSFTAWQIVNRDSDDETTFLTKNEYQVSYSATVQLSNDEMIERVVDSTASLSTAAYSSTSLGLFIILTVLAIICLGVTVLIGQGNRDMYVSFVVWVAVVGIYGLLILLALFVFHPITLGSNRATIRENLTNQIENEIEAESTQSESEEPLTVKAISLSDFEYVEEAKPNLSLGAGLVGLGMLGLLIQVFIPRDLSNISTASTGDRSEGSGVVQTYSDRIRGDLLSQFMILTAILFALLPVVFIASSAFNPSGNLSTRSLIPTGIEQPSDLLLNFRALLFDEVDLFPFPRWVLNSFIVATTTTVIGVLITALSAYSFSRFRFAGRRQLLLSILLMQVFPNLLAMVALFLMLQQITTLVDGIPAALPFLARFDWSWIEVFGLDSLGGLILVYLGGVMGINTWLMKGFFDSIPRDIDESALVDGATHWQIFWLLIIPLVRPILAVVAILSFVGSFNEFVLARVLLRDKENWTLMVGLFEFVNADFNNDWGKFAAGALMSSVPVVVIYIALQDQIVGGLTAGSVKG